MQILWSEQASTCISTCGIVLSCNIKQIPQRLVCGKTSGQAGLSHPCPPPGSAVWAQSACAACSGETWGQTCVASCLTIKTNAQPGGWLLLGFFFFFQMSEPENLCVCTHVLLPLSTVSPKRQFPFLTNSASLLCLGRHRSSKQHCKIWFPTSTLVYLWGKEHPSD